MSFPSTIQFHGRWDLEGDKCYATWCGSSLHFRTTSRSINLELGDLTTSISRSKIPNIAWYFGSQSKVHRKVVKGPKTLLLEPDSDSNFDTDSEVPQDVSVMLCDWGAALHILRISTTDGKSILAPEFNLPVKPLLFIGASLVSGFSPVFRTILPLGSLQAFASVAARILRARRFDVRLEIVAYPGLRLMTTDYDKGMEDVFWEGKEGLGGWNTRSKDSPDDIYICVGTNDRAWGEETDQFLEHYKAFLIRLRNSYRGSCKRIHVISPFGTFHDTTLTMRRTVYEPDVQHMVEKLAGSWISSDPKGTRLYHISTEGWIDKSLTCDGLHPTVEGHEKIGARLVEYMDSLDVA